MYKDAEIDIFEHVFEEQNTAMEDVKRIREVFKPVAFQQHSKRSLPQIDKNSRESSSCQDFYSSYLHLFICFVSLTAVLCASVFFYVECATKSKTANLEDISDLNRTAIPSWNDLPESTETATAVLRTKYFPAKLNDEKEDLFNIDKEVQENTKEIFCPDAIFVILIIISSSGMLFVIILALLPNKC